MQDQKAIRFLPACVTQLPGTPGCPGSTRNRANRATEGSGLAQSRPEDPRQHAAGWAGGRSEGTECQRDCVQRPWACSGGRGSADPGSESSLEQKEETRQAWGAGEEGWGEDTGQGQRPPWQSLQRPSTGSERPLCVLLRSQDGEPLQTSPSSAPAPCAESRRRTGPVSRSESLFHSQQAFPPEPVLGPWRLWMSGDPGGRAGQGPLALRCCRWPSSPMTCPGVRSDHLPQSDEAREACHCTCEAGGTGWPAAWRA